MYRAFVHALRTTLMQQYGSGQDERTRRQRRRAFVARVVLFVGEPTLVVGNSDEWLRHNVRVVYDQLERVHFAQYRSMEGAVAGRLREVRVG